MRNILIVILAALVVIGLAVGVFAQNRTCCGAKSAMIREWAMLGNNQQQQKQEAKAVAACPFGSTQPTGEQQGWWNKVEPTTPEQELFVEKAKNLHQAIRDKQFQISKMQDDNASADAVKQAQDDLAETRADLQKLMMENRELRQQLNIAGGGSGVCVMEGKAGQGNGECAMGAGPCGGRGMMMRGRNNPNAQ